MVRFHDLGLHSGCHWDCFWHPLYNPPNLYFPKEEKICFAYLDGFDWIYEEVDGWIPDWIPEQIEYYSRYGLEMNNENSQLSHLTISKAVAEHAIGY